MTDIAVARQHSLGDLPRRSALRFPDKRAIIQPGAAADGGDLELTFRQFDETVDRTAAAIAAAGLLPGERLALVSRNCWQFAVLAFAAARAGVMLVPINFMLGGTELAYILAQSGAKALVAQPEFCATCDDAIAQSGAPIASKLVIGDTAGLAGWQGIDTWLDFEGAAVATVVADDQALRMMFTSGTESQPKGALLSSRALMWQYVSAIVDGEMSHDDVELHTLPLYHCAQLDCFLGVDVYLGATSIILPAPEPGAILRTIARERVTKFFAPPTVWIALLRHPDFDRTDLSSLSKGYYGASPMPVEILKEIQQRLPQLRLWNFYGQTEMAPVATILRPEEQQEFAGSAGRPALNVETRVVDDSGEPVAPGVVGEIVHRSPHLTLGYFNDEQKTAESFTGGWFHSGDLGYFTETGHLYVVDRKKDMIKTGGESVASREIEEAIYTHEGVAEVAVFGVHHPHWVEAVTAAVVAKPDAALSPEAVLEHARSVLAGYKAPKHVVIVDSLPKNPSGKILKRQLREAYADVYAGASQ